MPSEDLVDVAAAVNGNGDGILFFPSIDSVNPVGGMNAVRVDGKTGTFSAAVQVSVAGNYAPNPWKALLDDRGNAYIMETRGVFRLAAGSNAYDATGLSCTCDNNTGGQMKLDRDGFPMAIWGAAEGLEAGRYH